MTVNCYALIYIDVMTLKATRIGFYSEESPTQERREMPATLVRSDDMGSFGEARDFAMKYIGQTIKVWRPELGQLLSKADFAEMKEKGYL